MAGAVNGGHRAAAFINSTFLQVEVTVNFMQSLPRCVKRLGDFPSARGSSTSSRRVLQDTMIARAPLYQRVPPWWARWTYALIACDIFMTGSAIEITWNRWSTLVTDLENISSEKVTDSPAIPDHWAPRPTWQRLGLCLAHLGIGIGAAVALIVTQSRFIRTFTFLPPLPHVASAPQGDNRRLFIQCAHNWKNNGKIFPISRCSLEQGRDETEMILRVAGERGHWFIGLHDAFIHGRKMSVPEARREIMTDWGQGKRIGRWTSTTVIDSRWKSGPIRRLDH